MASSEPTRVTGLGLTIPPGTRLNGIFEIERQIGAGGMGMVYRAHNVETGDKVAIKIVRAEMAGNEQVIALFRKEAAVLHRLLHDAIVRYYLFTSDPAIGRPYLATEFVDGTSLAEMGAIACDDVLALAERLASGLQAAHEYAIFHRDISPDNVILPDRNVKKAKIIDFGIARAATLGGGTVIGDSIAGKFDYMSPEQLGLYGGQVDARSDIYSLGIVLAEAVLGRGLKMGGTQLEVVEKRRKVPDLSAVDPKLRGLISQMMQPRPEDRIATMAEVAETARALRTGSGTIRRSSGRALPKIAAGLLLLVVVGGAGAYFLLPGERDASPPPAPPLVRQDAGSAPPLLARRDSDAGTTGASGTAGAPSSGSVPSAPSTSPTAAGDTASAGAPSAGGNETAPTGSTAATGASESATPPATPATGTGQSEPAGASTDAAANDTRTEPPAATPKAASDTAAPSPQPTQTAEGSGAPAPVNAGEAQTGDTGTANAGASGTEATETQAPTATASGATATGNDASVADGATPADSDEGGSSPVETARLEPRSQDATGALSADGGETSGTAETSPGSPAPSSAATAPSSTDSEPLTSNATGSTTPNGSTAGGGAQTNAASSATSGTDQSQTAGNAANSATSAASGSTRADANSSGTPATSAGSAPSSSQAGTSANVAAGAAEGSTAASGTSSNTARVADNKAPQAGAATPRDQGGTAETGAAGVSAAAGVATSAIGGAAQANASDTAASGGTQPPAATTSGSQAAMTSASKTTTATPSGSQAATASAPETTTATPSGSQTAATSAPQTTTDTTSGSQATTGSGPQSGGTATGGALHGGAPGSGGLAQEGAPDTEVAALETDGGEATGGKAARPGEQQEASLGHTEVPQDEPTDPLLAFLQRTDLGPCTFLELRSHGPGSADIVGYGNSVPPFQRLDRSFQATFGFPADINLRPVADAQCPAVDLASALAPPGEERLRLTMDKDDIKPGGLLSGRITGIGKRQLHLYLVAGDGHLYGLADMLDRKGENATFRTVMAGTSAGAPQHLLVAVAADDVPNLPARRAGSTAEELLTLRDLLAADPDAEATLGYFKYGD